jgi:hypothetical protein
MYSCKAKHMGLINLDDDIMAMAATCNELKQLADLVAEIMAVTNVDQRIDKLGHRVRNRSLL